LSLQYYSEITIYHHFRLLHIDIPSSPSSHNPHASLMTTPIPRSTAVMSFITHAISGEPPGAMLASKYTASAFLYTTHLSVLKPDHISAGFNFYPEDIALRPKLIMGLEAATIVVLGVAVCTVPRVLQSFIESRTVSLPCVLSPLWFGLTIEVGSNSAFGPINSSSNPPSPPRSNLHSLRRS